MLEICWQTLNGDRWRFPKMGAPLNHPFFVWDFHEVNYQIPLETVAKTMPFLPPHNIITIFIAGISTMTKWVVNMTFPDANHGAEIFTNILPEQIHPVL